VRNYPVKPYILAVDTTHEAGSIALARGAEILEERALQSPSGFGHVIFCELRSLLARHGLGASDIELFAAASGPGSFTGVRVGLACIKGLAEATAKPAAAVSNLAALAYFGTAGLRAVLMDARRGEVYAAVYDAALRPVQPERVVRLDVWLETLPEAVGELIAPDFGPFAGRLANSRVETIARVTAPKAMAAAVAAIAFEKWRRGEAQDPALIDANYIRRADAELFWKE
jgi:tRNA threonylcarbamoyladenosine biosynthesis protein TsaB